MKGAKHSCGLTEELVLVSVDIGYFAGTAVLALCCRALTHFMWVKSNF